MKKDRAQGAILMAIGVGSLNFVYLWDMIIGKHDGMVFIGMWSWVAIAIANIVIVASMVKMVGRDEDPESEGGGGSAESS